MNNVISALVPVFAVILLGYIVQATKLIKDNEWSSIDHLCYYVLFPALIVKTLGTADLSAAPVFRIATAMFLTISTMSLFLFALRKPLMSVLSLDGPGYTSMFQGTTRWHTFVAVAIIAALYGDSGLVIASIGVAVMIPLLNLYSVSILSHYGKYEGSAQPPPWNLLLRNPFILSCAVGIILNLLPVKLPSVMYASFELVGQAVIGITLITVGAALQLSKLAGNFPAVFSTAFLRLIGMPSLMILFCLLLNIKGEPLIIALICVAVPTASSSYTLARKMGGDAELMAAMITAQVLLAIITLPLVISIGSTLAE
jgi:predicted permease